MSGERVGQVLEDGILCRFREQVDLSGTDLDSVWVEADGAACGAGQQLVAEADAEQGGLCVDEVCYPALELKTPGM